MMMQVIMAVHYSIVTKCESLREKGPLLGEKTLFPFIIQMMLYSNTITEYRPFSLANMKAKAKVVNTLLPLHA